MIGTDTLLSLCLGLGLAAACGFRIFVPLLILNLAARGGYVEFGGSFELLASTPALVAFAVATLLEIAAYYIPAVDHVLDTVASPLAVVAGVLVSASVITGMDPFLKWTLALIAGGGLAGAVQVVTAGTRGISGLTTLGLGNPAVATAEAAGATGLSLIALILPVLAVVLVLLLLVYVVRRVRRRRTA
ncbi:MAG: DUF4126 domain-containing protein [Thermoanaerobaculia bacterium]